MKVLYKPGETSIRTIVTGGQDGKLACCYTGKPAEFFVDQGYVVAELDDILPRLAQAQRDRWCGPWREISEEDWMEMLGCLPPGKWLKGEGRELFRMTERTSGLITGHYARIGDRYFCAQREITAEYAELFEEIERELEKKGEEDA